MLRPGSTEGPVPIDALRARLSRSSLRGTERDGGINVDASGRIAADESLRRLFDYYLSLTGEFRIDEIRQLLLADLSDEFGPGIAAEAAILFGRYLGMREELAAVSLPVDLVARFAQIQALRRQWFGPDAARLFANEDAHTAHTLERITLLRDPTLGAEQRGQQLAQIEARRPAWQRIAEQESSIVLLAEQQSRQFEQLGINEETRAAERAALWGNPAARRLAALDRERAQWQRRVADYVRARERIMADARIESGERTQAVLALRRQAFDAGEQVRIESLESIGALVPEG